MEAGEFVGERTAWKVLDRGKRYKSLPQVGIAQPTQPHTPTDHSHIKHSQPYLIYQTLTDTDFD
jgi:hypothetical protein